MLKFVDASHNSVVIVLYMTIGWKKRKTKNDLQTKSKRLKEEMKETSMEQKNIKDGQLQVREKLRAIEMEYKLLQEETMLVIQRSALTQLRLALMLNIVKARDEGDFSKAAQITQLLREIIARDNMQQQKCRNE
ncbi:hypothetical protein DITRI_Ditri12bG0006400 [Diplodiscus trichospermus]